MLKWLKRLKPFIVKTAKMAEFTKGRQNKEKKERKEKETKQRLGIRALNASASRAKNSFKKFNVP